MFKFVFKNAWNFLVKIAPLLLLSIIILFCFIKLNTPLAANITDYYLRPILGDQTVVIIENFYFNFSDSGRRIITELHLPSRSTNLIKNKKNLESVLGFTNDSLFNESDKDNYKNIPLSIFPDVTPLSYSYLFPDHNRPYARASVIKIDTGLLSMGAVAGTKEPGGKVGNPGPGLVPKNIVESGKLVAAFSGGFQYSDGGYGMVVNNQIIVPLKNNVGSIVGYRDGSVKILNYFTELPLGGDINFIRQNCPLLIKDGSLTILDPANQNDWEGAFLSPGTFTLRSGIGTTKDGSLIYVVGNNLSPLTLSQALKTAGAENAIQLDIHPHWTRFILFQYKNAGQYESYPLRADLYDGSEDFLNGYKNDFFYLYKK